jgi:hypothetical protein
VNGELFEAPRRIGYVYRSRYLRVPLAIVFDERSVLMPEYTGPWDEKQEAIMRDKPASVEIRA